MMVMLLFLCCYVSCVFSLDISTTAMKVSDKWKLTIPKHKQNEYLEEDEKLWKYLNENIPEALR